MIRVSDVLKLLYPNSLDWVEEHHLERGTRLHYAMECYVNNLLMEDDRTSVVTGLPEEEAKRVLAMIHWMDQVGFVPLEAEGRYESKLGFIAHPDCVGAVKTKGLTIDWKFVAAGYTEQNEMQAEAYRQITGNPVWLVQCDNEAVIKAKKCKPRPDLWANFLSGLNVLKFQQRNGG